MNIQFEFQLADLIFAEIQRKKQIQKNNCYQIAGLNSDHFIHKVDGVHKIKNVGAERRLSFVALEKIAADMFFK